MRIDLHNQRISQGVNAPDLWKGMNMKHPRTGKCLTKTDTWYFSAAVFASIEPLATSSYLPAYTCWHQHQEQHQQYILDEQSLISRGWQYTTKCILQTVQRLSYVVSMDKDYEQILAEFQLDDALTYCQFAKSQIMIKGHIMITQMQLLLVMVLVSKLILLHTTSATALPASL